MIITKGLGYREMEKLGTWIIWLSEYYTGDELEKCDVGYDVHYDECYIAYGFNKLYESDFDYMED